MEARARTGHLQQNRRGSEPVAELVIEHLEDFHHPAGAEIIDHAQRSTTEGGEPDAEEGANVAIPRAPDHAVGPRHRGLVEHREHEPSLDPRRIGRRDLRGTEQPIHRLVGSGLVAAVVPVEAAAALPAQPVRAHQQPQRLGRLHPVAERLMHHLGRLLGHVEAYFIEQSDRADRKSPRRHRPIDELDGHSRREKEAGFVEIGREDSIDPEAGVVGYHDDGLSHPPAEPHRGDDCLGARLVGRDHLQQRHLLHRRKEMHAEHPLRMPRALGDVPDRNRGRVAGEDGVGPRHRFDLRQYRPLELEVLVHRLDHEIGAGEAAVTGRARQERTEPFELRPGEPMALEASLQNGRRRAQPLPDPGHFRILEAGVHLDIEYRGAGDARAHESGAHDAEPPHLPGNGTARHDAIVLPERRRREEDLHQLSRHITHGELAEGAVLLRQACRDAVLDADPYNLERRQWRRIVAGSALEHLRASRPVHQSPSRGRAVEQQPRHAALR